VPQNIEVAEPLMDRICLPPFYSVTDHDDYHPLMKLAKTLHPKVIVELGTAHGNTTANLARHCPDARLFTVNAPIELMTGDATTFNLTQREIGSVYRDAGYSERVVQIYENTLHLDLSKSLEGSWVDLGIVDACHDIDYVINDFLKIEPFVGKHGVVLLHDTHPSMEGHVRGSYIGCMKLRQRGFDIRYLRNTWWGIWCKDWSHRFGYGSGRGG
jgi:predicted O-methyltransferase YrrM